MPVIKLIENSSEIGAGTRGAGLGIGALKVVAHNRQSDYFGRYDSLVIQHENEILNEPTAYNYGKRIDGLVKIYERVADAVYQVLTAGDFPLVLAGDHASAGGTIAGIKKAFPASRLGVIWIDAHADIHTPYTTPSGNIHGMPLATAVNEDNISQKVNDPKPETIECWEKLKSIGGIKPKVSTDDIVFVGVRDTEAPEDDFIARKEMKNFSVDEVRSLGITELVRQIDERLKSCDLIYVSFDVDSMDPEMVSRGTGTPVANGLSPAEASDLVNKLASWEKVRCIEMVEINPCLDDKINKMAETAFEILETFTSTLENKL